MLRIQKGYFVLKKWCEMFDLKLSGKKNTYKMIENINLGLICEIKHLLYGKLCVIQYGKLITFLLSSEIRSLSFYQKVSITIHLKLKRK